MYLLIALFLILFESIPEALADNGKKTIAGILEFIYRAAVTLVVFAYVCRVFPDGLHFRVFDFLKVIIGYLMMRFAIFDISYNLIRKLPVFFVGETKLSDKLLRRFLDWTKFDDVQFLFILKLITFIWGLAWLLIQNP